MIKTGLKGLDSNFFEAPTNKRLLKSAVIYGPNASEKSGFLYAFRALDYLVNRSSDDESTGTRSLFVIGGIVLDALEEGKLLIVDEFEKNLHPAITEYLIKLFHNDITNPKNAQLVFATHDVTQLSNDNFRRDQIWFTQKDEYGATELFRASDIGGVRLNTPLDKWYASGRFGVTPIIDDSDFLIAMQEGSGEG